MQYLSSLRTKSKPINHLTKLQLNVLDKYIRFYFDYIKEMKLLIEEEDYELCKVLYDERKSILKTIYQYPEPIAKVLFQAIEEIESLLNYFYEVEINQTEFN
jgi:hypothetical protein